VLLRHEQYKRAEEAATSLIPSLPEPIRSVYQIQRAFAIVWQGDHARAAAEAKVIAARDDLSTTQTYQVAGIYALAAGAVSTDGSMDETQRKEQHEEYATATIDVL